MFIENFEFKQDKKSFQIALNIKIKTIFIKLINCSYVNNMVDS